MFQYTVNMQTDKRVTKRIALSCISQIFDPLGLISPIVILAKLFIQRLWEKKIEWDETLTPDLDAEWTNFIYCVQSINSLKIPRFLCCTYSSYKELHGFCDASQKAYAACVYLKNIDTTGRCNINLICAKTKVAPLKSVNIPRLELCGALILARLVEKTKVALNLDILRTIYWSDSTVVLSWINTSPHLLKSFVGNRITEIQEISSAKNWRHVPTKDNPADLASRGAYANTLEQSQLWWHGPSWLLKEQNHWPGTNCEQINIPEMRQDQTCHVAETTIDIFSRYSSFSRLIRVVSYMLRFKTNCFLSKQQRKVGPLTITEIDCSSKLLVRLAQRQSFNEDIVNLMRGKRFSNKSKLLQLNPFIDEVGIMRVGGRLQNSQFSEDKRFPMILCSKHILTKLIFNETHLKLLHAGPQLLLSQIRETYWPIGGRNLAKFTVRNCTTCFRANPKPLEALMGSLPANRFEAKYPFYITGVDYAGPFTLKEGRTKKVKLTKAYISLFICLVTRAIHLEIVSELSTEAFLMVLRRFIARRGKPAHIYSDNGTNFVGTNNKLRELASFLNTYKTELNQQCTNESIAWHFIPAHSPHFGGMWEAGVKCVKHHLRRTMGNVTFTFEEFSTITAQIESILNSRPISPLSNNINDLSPLTPGHFLIGRPLTNIPDPNLDIIPDNRLRNYERIQRITQHFWSRWSKEYISELQQRQKWKRNQQNITTGIVVVIKDDKLPPLSWILGKVVELHPGSDGVVRVVSLRTSAGIILRRAITKICPLPCDSINDA